MVDVMPCTAAASSVWCCQCRVHFAHRIVLVVLLLVFTTPSSAYQCAQDFGLLATALCILYFCCSENQCVCVCGKRKTIRDSEVGCCRVYRVHESHYVCCSCICGGIATIFTIDAKLFVQRSVKSAKINSTRKCCTLCVKGLALY